MQASGHRFCTETDTETLAHLIEAADGDALEARVIAALAPVVGTYGLAVVSADDPGKVVVARQGSPVLLGIAEGELFVASDASAILEHTRSVVYLDDGDIAVLTPTGYHIIDTQDHVQLRPVNDIDWDLQGIELGGHPHFMLKEICEQAETVRSTLRGRLLFASGAARLNGLNLSPEQCAAIRRIVIVGCGTSWHAGVGGRHLIQDRAGIPVQGQHASEYRHTPPLGDRRLVPVAIWRARGPAGPSAATSAAPAAGRPAP